MCYFMKRAICDQFFSFFKKSITVGNVPNLLFFAKLEAIVNYFVFTDFIFDYT
jgi:hypothetical protein